MKLFTLTIFAVTLTACARLEPNMHTSCQSQASFSARAACVQNMAAEQTVNDYESVYIGWARRLEVAVAKGQVTDLEAHAALDEVANQLQAAYYQRAAVAAQTYQNLGNALTCLGGPVGCPSTHWIIVQ